MVNHGLSTGGLFALVGMIYERYHTREIASFGGLARKLPVLSFFMLLFTFSSIGLPGMNGFAGEFLILLGMFQRAWTGASAPLQGQLLAIAVLSVSGVVLGAWYMLQLVRRVFFGPHHEPPAHAGDEEHAPVSDMNLREILALAPLVLFIFWIGLRPGDFLTPMNATLEQATRQVVLELDKQQSKSQTAEAPTGERGASAP
jgi:NADH-quinone oxidoreductase subunit M